MNTMVRMIKNSVALAMADLVVKGFHFALIFVLARRFTLEEFAEYITFVTVVCVTLALTDMGVQHILVKELAGGHGRSQDLIANTLLVSGGMASLGWLMVLCYAGFSDYDSGLRNLLMIAGVAVIGNSIMQTAFAVFRGSERMEIQGGLNVLHQLMLSALGISLALMGFGVKAQVILIVCCSLVIATVSIAIVHKRFVRLHFRFDKDLCLHLIAQSLPLGVLLLSTGLLRWLDILILGQIRDMSDVAIYAAASKVFDGVTLLVACGVLSAVPAMAQLYAANPKKARHLYLHSRRVFAVFGLGAAGGLIVLADSICLVIFGTHYSYAATPLRVLGLSVFFVALCGPMYIVLMVSREVLIRFLPIIGGVVVLNVVLNLLLVPTLGYVGASIAFLLSVTGLFAVSGVMGKVCFGELPSLPRMLLRPSLASAGMVGALWFLRGASLGLTIPLGAAIFVVLLNCFGEFHQEPFYRELFGKVHKLLQHFRVHKTDSASDLAQNKNDPS